MTHLKNKSHFCVNVHDVHMKAKPLPSSSAFLPTSYTTGHVLESWPAN